LGLEEEQERKVSEDGPGPLENVKIWIIQFSIRGQRRVREAEKNHIAGSGEEKTKNTKQENELMK